MESLLFAEAAGHKAQKGFLLLIFPHEHNIKGLVAGHSSGGMEMTEKIAEVVCASRRGTGGIQGGEVVRQIAE